MQKIVDKCYNRNYNVDNNKTEVATMRLWHYKMIPYLPKPQLLGQWRELNSIYKKQDNHILINYIYEYPQFELMFYSLMVLFEMNKRGYHYNLNNYYDYFEMNEADVQTDWQNEWGLQPFARHHNFEYLTICYYNLKEKYIRGQKDFSDEIWQRLDNFYKKELEE